MCLASQSTLVYSMPIPDSILLEGRATSPAIVGYDENILKSEASCGAAPFEYVEFCNPFSLRNLVALNIFKGPNS